MINDVKNYSNVICNYLNNLNGEIEHYEVKNLMWCMFGLENDSYDDILITDKDIHELSCYVSCDNEDKFYDKITSIYKNIIENRSR